MKNLFPKLVRHATKGHNGRLAIIGGCLEYTGAPFYASLAQLKGGSDLAHIFCTRQAAIPIKAYSPEVITHPYLYSFNEEDNPERISELEVLAKINRSVKLVEEWQGAFHSFVIGPGLGRDQWIERYIGQIIEHFSKGQIVVLDADGLWYLTNENSNHFTIHGSSSGSSHHSFKEGQIYRNIVLKEPAHHILTPNPSEFERLWNHFMLQEKQIKQEQRAAAMEELLDSRINRNNQDTGILDYIEVESSESDVIVADAVRMAKQLNGINIIQKGMIDVITNGEKTYLVTEKSSPKRCGGIGDILSGLAGLYCYWGQKSSNLSSQESDDKSINQTKKEGILNGCILSSCVARKASYSAYKKNRLSLTAPNILDCIGPSFMEIYDHYLPEEKNKF